MRGRGGRYSQSIGARGNEKRGNYERAITVRSKSKKDGGMKAKDNYIVRKARMEEGESVNEAEEPRNCEAAASAVEGSQRAAQPTVHPYFRDG